MAKYEFLQPKFTEGVLAKAFHGRSSEEFYSYGLKSCKNMIPTLSGPCVKRPGTNYIDLAKNSSATLHPFFKDKDNTYILEIGYASGSSYLRVWSQDRLLKNKDTTPATFEINGLAWSSTEINNLKTTQSGDYIFVCCPTRKPYMIIRRVDLTDTGADVCEDGSKWSVEEYVMEDGPYDSINIYKEEGSVSDKNQYTIKLKTEPTSFKEIANVEFDVSTNSIVLMNHGLQTGMKVRLVGTGDWGNLVNTASTPVAYSGTKDWYVVSTTSSTFKVSSSDAGQALEFAIASGQTYANASVKLSRPRYESGAEVVFKEYLGGNTETTTSNSMFTSADEGRLIRVNPLSRPLEAIGGIRWAWGIIKSGSVTTSGGKREFTVILKTEICNTRENTTDNTKGTSEFRLGIFSDARGWPQVAQIYQQRMVLAATTSNPSTIWLSKSADFFSFAPTEIAAQDAGSSVTDGLAREIITDSNGLSFTLDSDTLDEIKWLAESKKLAMGTSAGVYMLYGSETNLVVTPFRYTINRETTFSATDTPPIVVSNTLIYPQIGGKDVQALIFEGQQGQWFSSKISLKGYDIIKSSEIKKMIWQERPNNIIWVMMNDGRLLSLSYDRQAEFQAWAEHTLGGTDTKVTDIEMIPTASHDQLWLKVERTINGSPTYYVETMGRFPKEGALARNHYVFSDSALTKSISGKSFTVSSSSGMLVTSSGHGLIDTQVIRVSNTGGSLPTGLVANQDYYVKYVDANTFRLALTSGGTAIAYTNAGSPTHNWVTSTVNGLTHLVGQEVQIYYGGMQHINKTVATNGSVVLNNYEATDVVLGLPYSGIMETLEPASPKNQYSYSKRLLTLVLLIEESLGIQIEYNDLSEEILFRSMQNQMGNQIDLFSGKRELSLSGIGWDVHNLEIVSNGPFPMQINALVIESETGGT